MVVARQFEPGEWQLYRDLRLLALRDSPHAFGSTLAREEGFPDEEWITRIASGVASPFDLPLIAEESDRPAGLTWARIDPEHAAIASLYQVWVAPEFRRRGVAQLLLDTAITWARASNATIMALTVASANAPAVDFYRRAGFVEVGEPTPLRPDSDIMQQQMQLILRDT